MRQKRPAGKLSGVACAALVSALLNATGSPFVFSSTGPIALNEIGFPPNPATPYASTLNVAGMAGAKITKVTVTLHGLSHTFPSDISMLLVGPQGQSTILMAQTGGQNRYGATNLTLTLDDDATNSLPIYTGLASGAFRPTDGYLLLGYPHFPYDFPPPAPVGNSNSISSLSVFKNTDPSGIWSLFVVDDSTGDTGSLAGGWSLSLSLSTELQITRFQTNVVLSWPEWANNYSLRQNAGIDPGLWIDVTTPASTNCGRLMVTNPVYGQRMFFRLVGH